MRWAYCALVALSACYSPTIVGGAPCEPARDTCPIGQRCVATGSGGFCMGEGRPATDAGADSTTIDGGTCLGNKLLGSVCLSHAPTTPITFTTAQINTASVGAGNCGEIRAQTGGPSLCIVAGTTINVPAGGTVRAIGANPLVLIATQTITVDGGLDVSSRSGETIAGAPVLGAGARTAADCAAIGLDGSPGKLIGMNDYGGGGAAGGSFGTTGGAGGAGGNSGNIGPGNPVAVATPRLLVGGCPGGHGGDGSGVGGGAAGGNGGGAIYLLAGDSIAVAGKINASGSGGAGGTDGAFSSGAGGGGGAGGMIGLEAVRITVAGSLYANGGGGGGGGGGMPNNHGQPGADPTVAAVAASGGGGGNGGGGNGGNGSSSAQTGVAGKASNNNTTSAGGGGGGGAGVIRAFGTSLSFINSTVSPPST